MGVGKLLYVAVCSTALGASASTEGGEGRGHIVAAARLQLVEFVKVAILLCQHVILLPYSKFGVNQKI